MYYREKTVVSDDERGKLHGRISANNLYAYVLFIIVISQFFPLGNIEWWFTVVLLIVSRVTDMLSTKIALSTGGVELNPVSDPNNMRKLLAVQFKPTFRLIVISFLLGLINRWLGNVLLLLYSFIGFGVTISNIGQLSISGIILFSGKSFKQRLYIIHAFSIFVTVAAITIILVLFLK
ncbi:MAG: hypothetical protein WCG91_03500 [Candidatus Shapirobacteria bacterium]